MSARKEALLGDFFATHAGPAAEGDCVAALMERYRISEARARQWFEHALETETLRVTEGGILPRDLAPAEAVAHVLASEPGGLRWGEVVARVAGVGVCATKVRRAGVRGDERVIVGGDGVLRHVRFAGGAAAATTSTTTTTPTTTSTTTTTSTPTTTTTSTPTTTTTTTTTTTSTPTTTTTTTPTSASSPLGGRRLRRARKVAAEAEEVPVRAMPILRRRRVASAGEGEEALAAVVVEAVCEPRPIRVVRAIGASLSSSARAIEIDALRETVVAATSLDVGLGEIRSLVIAHAAAQGWHVRGGLVSLRRIPWADLEDVVTAAAKGHRRDPAELVARVRRLVRISSATAAHLRRRLSAVRA